MQGLDVKMRLALVSVFSAGRRLGAKEAREEDLPRSDGRR